MSLSRSCFGIFIDIAHYLYCASESSYQVAKRSLNSIGNTSIIVAGNGTAGSEANMINGPRGIFVDRDLNLYVADCWNNRIQLFRSGQLNGTTVAINGSNGCHPRWWWLPVHCGSLQPSYIRIGAWTNGFAADQLYFPSLFSFDSYGNMIIVDSRNDRLQKFLLASNECGECDTFWF